MSISIQGAGPATQAMTAPVGRDMGKSAQSVGHMAKAAVAQAAAAGADLPSNAQGLAASQIARGADPASVFAAFVPQVDPAGDAEPVGEGMTPADGAVVDGATPDIDVVPPTGVTDADGDAVIPGPTQETDPTPAAFDATPVADDPAAASAMTALAILAYGSTPGTGGSDQSLDFAL